MPARACLRSLVRCALVHAREVRRASRAWLRCICAAGRARRESRFTLCLRCILSLLMHGERHVRTTAAPRARCSERKREPLWRA